MFTFTTLSSSLRSSAMLLEHRRDGMARATPLGPEVDDHGLIALDAPPARRSSRLPVSSFSSQLRRLLLSFTTTPQGEAETLPLPRIDVMYEKLPPVPDHPALERGILEFWEREGTFEQLRERNRGGPRFSFMDGPITANNPMGVHHAWGRTLQGRLPALQGHARVRQRYQNGFDCQGLWVEVEVEKALGLNSKREIEEYGLAEFAAQCRERVAHFSAMMTKQSQRLGMWMDWDNDYFTFSDTNIEYIWRFLKEVPRPRLARTRATARRQWCPRCGTSLSQHELIDSYARSRIPRSTSASPSRTRGTVAGRVDDDAVDAARQRRRRSQARRRIRAARGSTRSPNRSRLAYERSSGRRPCRPATARQFGRHPVDDSDRLAPVRRRPRLYRAQLATTAAARVTSRPGQPGFRRITGSSHFGIRSEAVGAQPGHRVPARPHWRTAR